MHCCNTTIPTVLFQVNRSWPATLSFLHPPVPDKNLLRNMAQVLKGQMPLLSHNQQCYCRSTEENLVDCLTYKLQKFTTPYTHNSHNVEQVILHFRHINCAMHFLLNFFPEYPSDYWFSQQHFDNVGLVTERRSTCTEPIQLSAKTQNNWRRKPRWQLTKPGSPWKYLLITLHVHFQFEL